MSKWNQQRTIRFSPPCWAWEWWGEDEEEGGFCFRGWWVGLAVRPSTPKSLRSRALQKSRVEPRPGRTPSCPVLVELGSSGSAPWSPRALSSFAAEETTPTDSPADENWESDSGWKDKSDYFMSIFAFTEIETGWYGSQTLPILKG